MSPLVRDRMTSPAQVAPASTPLTAIVAKLEDAKISALPIVEGERLVGILSTTDLVRARAQGELSADTLAADRMNTDVFTITVDAPITEAARRLSTHRVHRLVVVDNQQHPVGVLSTRDLLGDVAAARIDRPIESIMTADPIALDVGESIDAGVAQLAESNVRGIVVTEGRRPVGVFTHTEALAARALPAVLRARALETVMSYETICMDAETPIHRAAAQAQHMSVRRLLVVSHRDLVGILSCLDLVAVLGASEPS